MANIAGLTKIEEFEKVCQDALTYEHAAPDYIEHYNNLLALIADDKKGEYRLMSAAVDYIATGEGRTLILFIQRVTSGRQFIELFLDRCDGWYARGADISEGLPPSDHSAMALFPPDGEKVFDTMSAIFFCEFNYNS